ncbi:hypothetical protein Tco_1015904 [Tanacetum coccineum]|uniref:Uncharacterized protein n=1 Tax=Tanacetum coccineum TaxID=301880 RepID=A0ABQ5FML2_9ASTR
MVKVQSTRYEFCDGTTRLVLFVRSFNHVQEKLYLPSKEKEASVNNLRQGGIIIIMPKPSHHRTHKNVIQEATTDDKGFIDSGVSQRHMTDTECLVLSPNFKLPDENQILLKVPRKDNMYSFDMKNIVPKESFTFSASTVSNISAVLEVDVMHVEAKVDGKDDQSKKLDDSTVGEAVTTAGIDDSARIDDNRGVVVQGPSEFRVPQEIKPSSSKDKGKGIMIRPEFPLKRKDQIALDDQIARDIQAKLDAELLEEQKLARKQEEEAT